MMNFTKMLTTQMVKLCLIITVSGVGLSEVVTGKEIGAPAPDFTLKSQAGDNVKLSELVGNVLLINFWASWCGPCKEEMPLLEEIHQKYKDLGFSVVAINVDENTALAEKFLSTISVTFPVLYDNSAKVSQLYDVDAMPTTVMVDRDGNMRFFHKSFKAGYEKHYEQEVKALVRE